MNHYGPRQREHDGRWDYTCRNDDWIRPVGYCVPWERIERELGVVSPSRWLEKLRPFADRFHEVGHAQRFVLCDEHRTREHVEQLYEPPAEAWTS